MKIVCDNCSTKYSIADEKVRGKVFKIKCKKCSHIIVVKGTEGDGPAPQQGFDQKETRVFDYSGFDGQPGGAQAAGGEPVWHLVIDREQVGPLSVAEVQAKWAAGEIDAETYAWREGFGDWQRLGSIDELAAALQGGAAAAAPVAAAPPLADQGNMFGDAPASGPTGRADPADLFAAAAAPPADDEGGGDLFDATRQAPSPFGPEPVAAPAPSRRSVPNQDLFAAVDAGGFGGGGEVSAPGGPPRVDVRPMTGQRNENSVLFSLSNLAALASSDTPSKAGTGPAPTFQSGTGPGTEGSGLIDIRAMAAMTLGSKKDDAGPKLSASEEDLPVFSSAAFAAPAAGVLLPVVQPAGIDRKWLFIVIGLASAALIAAVVVVVILLKSPRPVVAHGEPPAAAVPAAQGGQPAAGQPAAGQPAAGQPAVGQPTAPGGGEPPAGGAPTEGAGAGAATPPTGGEKKPEEGSATKATERRTTDRVASTERKPERAGTPAKPPAEERKSPAEEKKPPAAAADPPCDEVTCAIEPDKPCCKRRRGGGGDTAKPAAGADLPESLNRDDITNGMKAVTGRVMACYDQYKQAGTVIVKVSINGDGAVTGVEAQAPFAGTPTGACVERAVKNAKFRKWKGPSMSVKYPFTLR